MTRQIHGHNVVITPCDGLRNHWRVRADGAFIGLISSDTAGYHALVSRCPHEVLHRPTSMLALEALLDETFS
jgi:hypothetical protein